VRKTISLGRVVGYGEIDLDLACCGFETGMPDN
jgi:hypothetical protein